MARAGWALVCAVAVFATALAALAPTGATAIGSSPCGLDNFDLVFVLDESGSVGSDNWEITRQFASRIVEGLNVEANNIKYAASNAAHTHKRETGEGGRGRRCVYMYA